MKSGVILSGFSMVEMLLGLLVISIFVPMVVDITNLVLFDQVNAVEEMEDMMGIEQLRLYLAKGNIVDLNEDCLYYEEEKRYTLSIVNGHLTLQPGTLVFMTDVAEVDFYEDDYAVGMRYEKNNKKYDVWIGYK